MCFRTRGSQADGEEDGAHLSKAADPLPSSTAGPLHWLWKPHFDTQAALTESGVQALNQPTQKDSAQQVVSCAGPGAYTVHAAGDGSLSVAGTATDFPAAVSVSSQRQTTCCFHWTVEMAKAGKDFGMDRKSELCPNLPHRLYPNLPGTYHY